MTAKKFEGLVATVFAIAVGSGLVYAQVSRVDIFQGVAGIAGRSLGFGCQLKIFRAGGRVTGYIPSVAPNSFFEHKYRPILIRANDKYYEMESSYGSQTITIRFEKTPNDGIGSPREYEFRRTSHSESAVFCRDLDFELSAAPETGGAPD